MSTFRAQAVARTIPERGVSRSHPGAERPGQTTPKPRRPPQPGHRNGVELACLNSCDRSLVCLKEIQQLDHYHSSPGYIIQDLQNPVFERNASSSNVM